jgi:dynein heavy chain 1, cytosolic
MVAFYLASQKHFTTDIQAHYVYSPRELTRCVRGIYEAIPPLEMLSVKELVRVWAHETLRLFQDHLVTEEEKTWTDEHIHNAAMEHFPTLNRDEALHRLIFFSDGLPSTIALLIARSFVSTRKLASKFSMKKNWTCRLFSSTMFSTTSFEVIECSARCRDIYFLLESAEVARQVPLSLERFCFLTFVQTTLSRFVAWLNGLSIFQIKVSNKYTGDDFDDDLRIILRRDLLHYGRVQRP